jgi:hypothetical protein
MMLATVVLSKVPGLWCSVGRGGEHVVVGCGVRRLGGEEHVGS